LQAKLDGELGLAEGVILDQHLAECPACADLLLRQQGASATIFEAFAPHRLSKDLVPGVMDNLPEMDPLRIDVEGVNWRAKTPPRNRHWLAKLAPLFAALILLCLALPLYLSWPRASESVSGVIGVVTTSTGVVKCAGSTTAQSTDVDVKNLISCGDRYETGPSSRTMLSLRGPTSLKLDENTRIRVFDDRGINIDTGRVQLDVAKDIRPFVVNTPFGAITVLGTIFDVSVDSEKAIIILKNGKIHFENKSMQSDIQPGEQLQVRWGATHPAPTKVDAAALMQWADAIVPDADAYVMFTRRIQPHKTTELPGEEVFAIITTRNGAPCPIASFHLAWEPDGFSSGHCGYDVRICNEAMVELFKTHIDPGVFADKTQKSYQVDIPGEPIRNTGVLHVKLIPDFKSGDVLTTFSKVWALGI
jgi:hypothetical protein